MSRVIGRGRYATEVYPSTPQTGSFNPTPFLNQTAWFVNYDTGNNANDGKTPETAVAQVGEVRRRWDGGLLGVRPTLPAIDITVTVAGDAPDFTDPLSALWDLDAQPGCSLVIDCTTTVKRSGTIATVPNAFARTPTGQQTVTDAGVVSWTPDVDQLLVDTTSGAASWVVTGGSPGTIAASRAVSTTAPAFAITTAEDGLGAAAVGASDAYEILTLPEVYFGANGTFALGRGTSNGSGVATVLVRRGHGVSQGSADTLTVNGSLGYLDDTAGALVMFVECITDQARQTNGGVIFANCAAPAFSGTPAADKFSGDVGSASGAICGYARRGVFLGGGGAFLDQDFQVLGAFTVDVGEDFALPSGSSFIGNFGRFLDGGASTPIGFAFGADATNFGAYFDGEGVCYGTTSGGALFKLAGLGAGSGAGGNIHIVGTASSTFVFDGGTAAFFQIANQDNAFAFNPATGLFVGPTAITLAHLDAAVGAGTGFGGNAYWFPTDSKITVVAA